MTAQVGIAIVGAGVSGLILARVLAARGRAPVIPGRGLLDRVPA